MPASYFSSLWYWLTSLGWAEGWLWTAAAWAPWALAMVVVTVGALPSLTAWWWIWSAEARARTERTATKACKTKKEGSAQSLVTCLKHLT